MGTKAHLPNKGVMRTGKPLSVPEGTPILPLLPSGGLRETPLAGKYPEEAVLPLLRTYRRSQNTELRDQIVMQFTNLVESIARRYSSTEPFDDLVQEGYIGLITAIDLYDLNKKVKFSTYATHFIIGQIKHYLRDKGKLIKEPGWLQEANYRLKRISDKLTQELGRSPLPDEIATVMGISEEEVEELLATQEVFKVTSFEGVMEAEERSVGRTKLSSPIHLDCGISVERAFTTQRILENRLVLQSAMTQLKDLEQTVIGEFYFQGRNQTEIAQQLGVSGNYVSYLLRNATKRLKQILTAEEVRERQKDRLSTRSTRVGVPVFGGQDGIVDPVTRLYNRHYFLSRLEEEVSRASRQQSELSLLCIKIGALEAFCRTHGSLKGQDLMCGLAETLRQTLRRADILTRYAEDTFAIILPHTGKNIDVIRYRLVLAVEAWQEAQPWYSPKAALPIGMGTSLYPDQAILSQLLTSLAWEEATENIAVVPMVRAA